jgi:hypothetical protein
LYSSIPNFEDGWRDTGVPLAFVPLAQFILGDALSTVNARGRDGVEWVYRTHLTSSTYVP